MQAPATFGLCYEAIDIERRPPSGNLATAERIILVQNGLCSVALPPSASLAMHARAAAVHLDLSASAID